MAKYEVIHSELKSPTHTFKQGEVVTEADLNAGGFKDESGIEFLLRVGAVEELKGTGDAKPAPAKSPVDAKGSKPADAPPAKK